MESTMRYKVSALASDGHTWRDLGFMKLSTLLTWIDTNRWEPSYYEVSDSLTEVKLSPRL